MVLNNTYKKNSIILEVFASVFTVSSYFTDNPRTVSIAFKYLNRDFTMYLLHIWIFINRFYRKFPG